MASRNSSRRLRGSAMPLISMTMRSYLRQTRVRVRLQGHRRVPWACARRPKAPRSPRGEMRPFGELRRRPPTQFRDGGTAQRGAVRHQGGIDRSTSQRRLGAKRGVRVSTADGEADELEDRIHQVPAGCTARTSAAARPRGSARGGAERANASGGGKAYGRECRRPELPSDQTENGLAGRIRDPRYSRGGE